MVEVEAMAVAEETMVEKMATLAAMGVAAAVSVVVWMVVLSFSAPSSCQIFFSFHRQMLWRIVLTPPCQHPCAIISHQIGLCSVKGQNDVSLGLEIAIKCWREKYF